MKTKEQVIEWLKSKEWYKQFKANVEKTLPFEKTLDWFGNYSLFFAAFDWASTPEGDAFWCEKCDEYVTWWYNGND